MKKVLLTLAAIAVSLGSVFAQGLEPLPNDPAVRVGKLDNGLTYYIRHNEIPAGRAEFYLATNVGAIQETPDQDGLAHFLEHMCFNGTKNFPGKTLLEYLQSIGASFGGNVNASTGVEQTVYMLNNIPLARQSVVDSCILIMHDYSHFVTCDPAEIDAERGVIVEERRARRNASWRLHERSLPFYYGDSKYATCTLIGSQENLLGFQPESLVNFYRTWYRPDLQALIVVGDIDMDYTEAKIKEIFADIPAAENPKPKDVIKIPDNEAPVIGILTDPEQSATTMEVFWKGEPMPEEYNNTVPGQLNSYIKAVISTVMSERLSDISAKAGAPFLNADFGIFGFCETMEAVYSSITAREGEAIPAFKAVLTEIRKMSRYGFTDDEINRAKDEISAIYENRVKNAETRTNADYVPMLLDNFFDNEPFMEPAMEYELIKQLSPAITAAVLNQALAQMVPANNMVIVYKAPEKEGLAHPTDAAFLAAIEEVDNSEIAANEVQVIESDFLDASKLKGGKIKKTSAGVYGTTVLTLSNGINVYLLPTSYEKDLVAFNIFRTGGLSVVDEADLPSMDANIWSLYQQNTGVSRFSNREVSKMLSGKMVSVSPYINELYSGVSGSATPKDLETALQLAYLYFADPRFDAEEYAVGMNTINSLLPNLLNRPDFKMSKRLQEEMYGHSPRHRVIDNDVIAEASLQTLEKVYRNAFKDAAGVSMAIVGDFDIETVKSLIAKYIGAIQKGRKPVSWIKTNDYVKGAVNVDFTENMATPMSTVFYLYHADMDYSVRNAVALEAASYILDMRHTTSLREEEGGTYGASSSAGVERSKPGIAEIQIMFNSKPALTDRLRELAIRDLENLAYEGPTAEEFDKAVKNMQKNHPENLIKNGYWMGKIITNVLYGVDEVSTRMDVINNLKPEDVQSVLKTVIEGGNKFDFVMRPGDTAEAE